MSVRLRTTCSIALCAMLSSTALLLFAGIAAACSGPGGGGCTTPTASTGSATAITTNSATLNGSVNAQGCITYYLFEWGTSSSGPFPDSIEGSAGKETFPKAVSTNLTGLLQPGTQYYFRLSAINSEGKEATGSAVPFKTTAACPKPIVTTNAAASITDASASLSGSVNANGCQTTTKIEWGLSSSPNTYPNSVSGPSGTGMLSPASTVSGLQPNTGYHYRVSANNPSTGTTPGADKVFTTAKTRYVALGDSYSSGVGTGSYFEPTCKRSSYAYPELMRSSHPNWTVVNATCENSWASNVINAASTPGILTPDTKWVTYTVGGNDALFVETMIYCAGPELLCLAQLNTSQDIILYKLPDLLDQVNNAIKAKAPNAKVIVLDYPRLFNRVDCTGLYSLNEQNNLNAAADMMKTTISSATARAGSNFIFRDVIPGFLGHAVCDGGSGSSTEWINGPNLSKESFHPKIAGQQVYYNLVKGITG